MNKEVNEIIERHGYNLKIEVGNALSKIEAKNIIDNAITEAMNYSRCSMEFNCGKQRVYGEEQCKEQCDMCNTEYKDN